MSEWQEIKTAPRDGEVIVLDWGGNIVAGFYDKRDERYPWVILDRLADGNINGLVDDDGRHGPKRWHQLPQP